MPAKTAGHGKHTETQLCHWPYPIHTPSLIWRPPWSDVSGSVRDAEGQLYDVAHRSPKSSFHLLATLTQIKLDPMFHFIKEFQSKLHEAIILSYSKHDHVHTEFLKLHLSQCFCNLRRSSVTCLNFLALTSFLFISILEHSLGKKLSSKIFFLNLKAFSLTFYTKISHF